MATLALLFFGFLGSAQAQKHSADPAPAPNMEERSQEYQSDQTGPQDPPPDSPADETSADNNKQSSSTPMALDDARLNFPTVIESFIAEHSPHGYWPLKQKTTGKVLKLKFKSILPKSVRQLKEGLYLGRAVLREVQADSPITADFTVDFSGSRWKVEGMRLVSATPPTRKPHRKAPPRSPSKKKPATPD